MSPLEKLARLVAGAATAWVAVIAVIADAWSRLAKPVDAQQDQPWIVRRYLRLGV